MANLDGVAPSYARAKNRWPDAPTLSHCYEALVGCYDGNAHGMVEHVKSFIESVCLTILGEFGRSMPSSTPSTTDLLVAALRPLGLQNTRGSSKVDKVLSAHNKLADALTEIRNDHGALAHGKDAFLDAIAADHARVFLHTGDAILSILLNAFEGLEPDLTVTREPYERFPHLNERIDRAVGVAAHIDEDGDCPVVVFAVATGPRGEAIEIRTEPSRLLYGIDRSAYIEVLKSVGEIHVIADDGQEADVGGAAPTRDLAAAASTPLSIAIVPDYTGRLAMLRSGLEGFLLGENVLTLEESAHGMSLTDSLLATADQFTGLDWTRREALQARLKVASKRVLVRFGCDAGKAEEVAERLVAWMRIQAPDSLQASQEVT